MTVSTNAGADTITAGAGNDSISSGDGNDSITLGSGNDHVDAGAGADTIVGGANVTVNDTLTGGADNDVLTLTNDNATTDLNNVTQIEHIQLADGNSYSYTISDGSAFDGDTTGVIIDGSLLTGSNTLTFDASNLSRAITILGGAGNDTITAGTGNDSISSAGGNDYITLGTGNNYVDAGAGADTIVGGANLTVNDTLIGGGGTSDLLTLTNDNATTDLNNVTQIEHIQLADGNSYSYTISDGSAFDGDTSTVVTIDGQSLTGTNTLTFDAHTLSQAITILGGAGADTITGGAGADSIVSGDGNDHIYYNFDHLHLDSITDTIFGGNGNDTLHLTATGFNTFVDPVDVLTLLDNDFTNIHSVEKLVLADGVPNDITLATNAYNAGIHSIIGGTGNDTIHTSSVDTERASLTYIDFTTGGQDTIIFDNGVKNVHVTSSPDTISTDTAVFGGSGGGISSGTIAGLGGHVTDYGSGTSSWGNATSQSATFAPWYALNASDTNKGISAAHVYGFTPGDGGDVVESDFDSGFANDVNLTSNNMLSFQSGSVFEIATNSYALSNNNFGNLPGVATMLGSLNNVRDGIYYIIVYDGTSGSSNAGLYVARATEGDGFDFADTNGTVGGVDTDSVELIGVFHNVAVNSFTSQNFH